MTRRLAGLLLLVLAAPAEAQQGQRCFFQVQFVGDSGRQAPSPDGVNYFAGGGVRLACRGTAIRMSADSVASYQGGRRVEFIGKVKYRDSTVTLDADRGTYYKDGERWEARGSVKTANLVTGSTLVGPSVDYYRQVTGLRDTVEVVAIGRPTIRYVPKRDSVAARGNAKPDEPYVIIGDRVRLKGDERVWAAGNVTVDRSDLSAASDSMALDTGGGWQEGVLLGKRPRFKGMDRDTFELRGDRIDFGLDRRELRVVTAMRKAEAQSADRQLTGDVIRLHLRDRTLRRSLAWGRQTLSTATGPSYAARGDSLVFESPTEKLERVTAIGRGWVAAKADSATGDRDWIAGDTVIAQFRERGGETGLARIDAHAEARAFYRGSGDGKAKGGLAYVRGNDITVAMREDRDEVGAVDVRGRVDGIQLEPKAQASAAPAPGKKP